MNFWPWLIIGSTFLIYAHSLTNGFIWDDQAYLLPVGSAVGVNDFFDFWVFSHPLSAFPVTVFLLRAQCLLWGSHALGYHVISLLVHILNALLLFGVVRRIAPSVAGVTALLFAIHPIQVESVAWIAEQKNLWCFFFMMLAFQAYLDFDSRGKRKDYLRTFLFYLIALLCKCIAVCFSIVPVLYAWWQRGSVSMRDVRRAAPFIFLGLLSIVRPMINEHIGSTQELSEKLFSERLVLAGKNFFFYIKQIALPWKFLTAYPSWNLESANWGNWIYPFTILFFVFVLFRFQRILGRGGLALFCFYGVSIFPALGLFNVSLLSITPASDHFSYLSVPPVLLLLCSGVHRAWLWVAGLRPLWKPSPFLIKSLSVAGIAYLASLSFCLTFNYKDPVSFWRRLYVERPDSFIANNFLGIACLESGGWCNADRAILLLEKAHSLRPQDRSVQKALGIAYEKKGLLQPAIDLFLAASSGRDSFIKAHYFRKIGSLYLQQKNLGEAVRYMEKVLALRAQSEYGKLRQWHLRMTGELDTGEATDLPQLGQAYLLSGDFGKAADVYRRAILENPVKIEYYEGLADALMNLGDSHGARNVFLEAIRLAPESEKVKNNLDRISKLLRAAESK